MKICVDTNVVLDFFLYRQPFYTNARILFNILGDGKIEAIVGTSAVTDIFYLSEKYFRDTAMAHKVIQDLNDALTLVDTKTVDIITALNSGDPDFEDAVVYSTAHRENADYIITRNTVDFFASPVPALDPGDFLQLPDMQQLLTP
jgi:predicted nucleic acid-binding protein